MGYRTIWNQYFPERNNPNATVKSLLHYARKDDERIRICEALTESWQRRGSRIKILEASKRKNSSSQTEPPRKMFRVKIQNALIVWKPNHEYEWNKLTSDYRKQLDQDTPPPKSTS
jgi:hypothetical protein